MISGENILTDSSGNLLIKVFFSSKHPEKRTYREHHHAECELSLFIKGDGVYRIKNKSYDFHSGDVFLFNSDEVHCITEINSDCKLLNIHFAPRILWADKSNSDLFKIFFARSSAFENRIDRQNPHTEKIRADILNLEHEMSEKLPGYEAMTKYMLFSALTSLVRNYGYIDNSVKHINYQKTVEPMEKALDYINQNLDKPVTLAEIAHHAAMSQTYFSTVFKKLNGLSPWEYITIKRVETAINLLKTTDSTKLDIAMQCGFNSSSNFYKAFRKITGKRPDDFRH